MIGGNSGLSLFITNDVKNTMNRVLIRRHCLMGQENLCAEILQNDEFWLHLFQNSLFLLGQNERIVVNLKIS